MKKNFKFIVAAIAAVAMIGCAKDGGENGRVKEGVATNAIIKVSLPSGASRAFDDIVAPGESTIVDATVFIFNKITGRLTQKAPLTVTAGAVVETVVATTTGPKVVFVAINAGQNGIVFNNTDYPVDFVDEVTPANSTVGIMLDAFMKKEFLTLGANLPAVSGKFLMTGYNDAINFVPPTAAVPNPGANDITIKVGRAVAKVFMADKPNKSGLEDDFGITFKTLNFQVMNNPKEMYAFQKWSQAETGATPFGEIANKITGNGDIRTNYYRTLGTYTAAATSPALSAGLYIPENWNEISYARNATSLLIRGVVTFANKAIVVKNDGTAATYVDGQTFYRVWDKTNAEWLPAYFGEIPNMTTVRLMAGITSGSVTSAFSAKKTALTEGVNREFFIATYASAQCYWTLALFNPEQGNRHVVARNDAFNVTIATIKGIGSSNENDDNDDDGVIPENPPIDEIDVDVKVDIEMLNWHGITQEGNI